MPTSAKEPVAAESLQHAERLFENEIRPLLADTCFRCHGPKRQKGKLRLDSREAILRGGESGPALLPGKPAESLLMEAIRHESLEMPPDKKLSDRQVALIEQWIQSGAVWPQTRSTRKTRPDDSFTSEDRALWSLQPIEQVSVPRLKRDDWSRNDVDRFVLAQLRANQLEPSAAAEPHVLLRRLYLDLIGLPPTAEQISRFLADPSEQAYQQVIKELLASPHYGERWARHWLDLVRYAESDGYKADGYRPNAWRYRDYVIAAFNDDKPYDQFVSQQLAGDEVTSPTVEDLAATGYLRLWIYEYNQRDVRTQWQTILNDLTDVTADVFLGLGVSCARCHDHKFDPILQQDYYQLQSYFVAILPRDDLPLLDQEKTRAYQQQQDKWLEATAAVRRQLAELEADTRQQAAEGATNKFPRDIRPMMRKPAEQRDPFESQLVAMADRQVVRELELLDFSKSLKGEAVTQWQQLSEQLKQFDHLRPQQPEMALTVRDVGIEAPATIIPGSGGVEALPGELAVLGGRPAEVTPLPTGSSGRRTALADWITSPDNPLTARVLVNRLWQQHFGQGLVMTPNDFGTLATPPSHPALLDYLAWRFSREGWSIKQLHQLMTSSATYRQSCWQPASLAAVELDPDNRLLWKANFRRLDAEQIRDSMLVASGELDRSTGGPGEVEHVRRSIYLRVIRNERDPLLAGFDAADGFTSTGRRNVTTTPNQALMLINGNWVLERSMALASSVREARPDDLAARVRLAMLSCFARQPTTAELEEATGFLLGDDNTINEQAWQDYCHVLLNSNELLYID